MTHPFVSLRTALKSAKYTFRLADGAPELARLCDAYLEPWERYASRADLRASLRPAHQVGMVSNALNWQHVLAGCGDPRSAEVDEPVPRLLREFLAADENPSGWWESHSGARAS